MQDQRLDLLILPPFHEPESSSTFNLHHGVSLQTAPHELRVSLGLLCALIYLQPFHSTQYYLPINEFRWGVLWHGEEKHDVFGSCNYAEGGSTPQ